MPLFTTKEREETAKATSDTPYIIHSEEEFKTLSTLDKPKRIFWDDELRGGSFTLSDNPEADDGGIWFNGYKRDYKGAVHVEWFGLVEGDSNTDNSNAIRNALKVGSEVMMPAGVYYCNDIYIRGGQHFYGTGDIPNSGTTLKAYSDSTRAVVYADQPRTFIERVIIDGGSEDGHTSKGFSTDGRIYSNANFDIRLEKILIQNCNDNCLYAYNANHFSMKNCTIENGKNGSMCFLERCYVVTISECEFQFSDQIALEIKDTGSIGVVQINNCWFEQLTNKNILASNSYLIGISYNKFLNNLPSGIPTIDFNTGVSQSIINSNSFQSLGDGYAVRLGSGVMGTRIIDNTNIYYNGSPLTLQNVVDEGSVRTIIESPMNGYSRRVNSIAGKITFDDILAIDKANDEVNVNNIIVRVSGADRIIENVTGARTIVRSENSDVSLRGKVITITKATGVNGDWQEGLLKLSGAYLWVTSGKLYINTTKPTGPTDGTIVGVQS